jgi:hypothetical protein
MGLTNDLEAAICLERRAHADEDQRMVVRDQDPESAC